jgi:competence ComEA-like helix-hairpin-helix protein
MMMSDQDMPVNINTAEREELMTLPGVGPAIADRIIGGRPFTSIEDLKRISGIGSNLVENIQEMITVNDDGLLAGMPAEAKPVEIVVPETQEPVVEISSPESTLAAGQQPQEEVQPPAMDEYAETQPETTSTPEVSPPEAGQLTQDETQPPATGEGLEAPPTQQAPAPTQPRAVTLSQALWMAIGSGVLALVLAFVLSLGALATLNGGLQYVSPADLNALGRKVDGVTTQTQTLQQDLNGLRDRVNNLEGLSGRVTSVEGQAKQLRTDLDAASQQVGQINQQMTQLSSDIQALQNQTSHFQSFLDGLKSLLNQVTQP